MPRSVANLRNLQPIVCSKSYKLHLRLYGYSYMSNQPIDSEEVNPQGEPYRQLNQEEIEENAAKLLNLLEEGGEAAYREFYAELKAKGYQSQQITEITFRALQEIQKRAYSARQKLQQRIEEFRSLDSTEENN